MLVISSGTFQAVDKLSVGRANGANLILEASVHMIEQIHYIGILYIGEEVFLGMNTVPSTPPLHEEKPYSPYSLPVAVDPPG